MTLSLSSVAASSPSAAVDQGTRIRALAAVLRDAPQADAEVLLAGLARSQRNSAACLSWWCRRFAARPMRMGAVQRETRSV